MSEKEAAPIELPAVRRVCDATARVMDAAIRSAQETTDGGQGIDAQQVHAERVAYLATAAQAARDLLGYAEAASAAGQGSDSLRDMAALFGAETAHRLGTQIDACAEQFGVPPGLLDETLGAPEVKALIRAGLDDRRICAVGAGIVATRGSNDSWIEPEMLAMARDAVRQFAREEVAPHADRIHRGDELVPESIIGKMADLGYFGMSVPEEYGGSDMGNPAMIITTEELSAVSLAAAGSLITRPEILTKALLKGGTESQKRKWLPPIAAGTLMVGISVTEPDIGSDVAAVKCRAEAGELDGRKGYFIEGAKAWCTFAGRADVLAVLARTDPDAASGARGLSLFIVEKDPFTGHSFEMVQPEGGTLSGRADPTPGYRGMHSFTLNFERYFVPAENLVGEEGGRGKGFYLQMGGFAAGRLQTGGRATGVAQAALERAAEYAADRRQFGKPIGEFQLTQHKLGRMAAHVMAGRQLTYGGARAMDRDESATLEPAMAKLFASDVAVWVTQEAQLLHGGWGYAEEFPISRYVVDALVLPIFEGVKPILELKVVARALLAR